MHVYTEDPNAGNALCTCGNPEHSTHHPHEFVREPGTQPAGSATRCVCGKPFSERHHRPGSTAKA